MPVQILRRILSLIAPPHLMAGPARLRPLKFGDLKSFVNLFSDRSEHPLLWREIPTSRREGISILGKDYLKRILGTSCFFGIELDGELIGVVGFRKIDKLNQSAELDVFLKKDFRGKDIALVAVRSVLADGFSRLGLNRIYLYVDSRNENVQNMIQKSPLAVKEGLLRQNERIRGSFVDDVVYSILREDWLKARRSAAREEQRK